MQKAAEIIRRICSKSLLFLFIPTLSGSFRLSCLLRLWDRLRAGLRYSALELLWSSACECDLPSVVVGLCAR